MRLDSLPLVPHCLDLSMHLWILRKRGKREREWGREGGWTTRPWSLGARYMLPKILLWVCFYIAMAFSRAVVEGVPVTRDDSEQLLVPLPTFPQKLKPLWTAPAGA